MASTPAKQLDPQEVVLFDRSSMSFPPIGQSRHPSESALASAPFWTSTDGARPSLEPPGSGPGSRDSRSSSMPFDPLLITDRETRLNNVRRLSSQIQKLLQETQGELSKEAYNDLYQSAVSLLKAVDLLDPQQSSGRISDVFQMGSFSQSGAQQPPTQATMLAAVPNDLDWLSRRSMELFPRASFSGFPESPLVPQLAPPGPSSVHANGSTMLASSSSSSTSSSDAPLPVGTMQLGQIKVAQQQQQQMQQQMQQQQMQQQQQQMQQQQQQQQQIQQQLQQLVPPPRAVLQSPAPYFTNNSQMVVGPGQFAMQQYVRQQQLPSSAQQQPPPSAYYPRPFVTHQQPLTSSASFSPSTPSFQYTPTSPLRMNHSSRAPTEIVFTSNEQKPKKRLPANAKKNLKCMMCHVTETPEWRRGPNGDHTLCNACGLHYAKQLRKEKHASKKKRKTSIESILNKDKQTVTVTATPSAAAAAAIAHQSEKKSPVSGDDLGDSTT